jgi:lipid-binding SYLF domain-containing protein
MNLTRRGLAASLATLVPVSLVPVAAVRAAPMSDPQADRAAAAALRLLIASSPAARQLNTTAVAVLVFPKIVKAGFVFGGAYGEGVLRQGNQTLGYYNSAAASYGLQAGVQWFGYALFFMNAGALKYLDSSQGLEIGVGPSVVVVDQGLAKKFSSTTLTQDVYAFIFNQKGLMAGLGIEGSKITKV